MPVGIEAWVREIPPVTRTWLALSVLLSIAVVSIYLEWARLYSCTQATLQIATQQCQLVTPLQLYFSYKSAFEHFQVISLVHLHV